MDIEKLIEALEKYKKQNPDAHVYIKFENELRDFAFIECPTEVVLAPIWIR